MSGPHDEACKDCYFYENPAPNMRMGNCRRNPCDNAVDPDDDWCGEFKSKRPPIVQGDCGDMVEGLLDK